MTTPRTAAGRALLDSEREWAESEGLNFNEHFTNRILAIEDEAATPDRAALAEHLEWALTALERCTPTVHNSGAFGDQYRRAGRALAAARAALAEARPEER